MTEQELPPIDEPNKAEVYGRVVSEILETIYNSELTVIEAIGVLELVKQNYYDKAKDVHDTAMAKQNRPDYLG